MVNILLDIKTCNLTLREMMDFISDYQSQHPGVEVFMDGDLYAIVARD